jgi:serine O-acetyltransferase
MTDIALQQIEPAAERSIAANEEAVWRTLLAEAGLVAAAEPLMRRVIDLGVTRHAGFAPALASLVAAKLADAMLPAEALRDLALEAMAEAPEIVEAAVADLHAIETRDPAAGGYLAGFLYYKGFHALEAQRIGHYLWHRRRRDLARFLEARINEVFAVDIHPAVPIGRGVFIDHGTGVVVGETAVIGNDVSILQDVTLGGTGKERGDRHPKVRDGVLLAVGAKVLGNITVGKRAKVGAGSVVLKDVPPCATVAGVPAKIVGWCADAVPALAMDQSLPDREG